MRIVILAAVATLVACASPAQWRHADLSGAEADRAFLVADGECAARAHRQVRTPYTPPPPSDSGPMAISEYARQGGEQGAARGARQRVYAGCMAENGWIRSAR